MKTTTSDGGYKATSRAKLTRYLSRKIRESEWTDDLDAVAATWDPIARVEPARVADRELWSRAVERAEGWYPELTALEF